MYDDMIESYNKAKLNENSAGQERLTKVIRDLAKQIKDHEIYERETATRKTITRTGVLLGALVGDLVKEWDGKVLDASALIVSITLEGMALIETELDR